MKLWLCGAIVCLAACSDFGLGAPNGGEPKAIDHTLPNGAQLTLSPAAWAQVLQRAESTLADELDGTGCVGPTAQGGGQACHATRGACDPGCPLTSVPTDVVLTVKDAHTVHAAISLALTMQIDAQAYGFTCQATATNTTVTADYDLTLSVTADGLSVTAARTAIDSGAWSATGCSAAALTPFITGLLDEQTAQLVDDLASSSIAAAVDEVIPAPQQLNADIDLAGLTITGDASDRLVATHIGPGSDVAMPSGGFAMQIATGFAPRDAAGCGASVADQGLTSDLVLPATVDASSDIAVTISEAARVKALYGIAASGALCVSADVPYNVLADVFGAPLGADVPAATLTVTSVSGLSAAGELDLTVTTSTGPGCSGSVRFPFDFVTAGNTIEIVRDTIAVTGATDPCVAIFDYLFANRGANTAVFSFPSIVGLQTQSVSAEGLVFKGTLGTPVETATLAEPTVTATVIEKTVTLAFADGLEHAWRFAGGAWHPYTSAPTIVIDEPSLAFQGVKTIAVRARDGGSVSAEATTTLTIDYAPPQIIVADEAGGNVTVTARDAVDASLEYAITDGSEPTTWSSSATLANAGSTLFVRDDAGHVASARLSDVQRPDEDDGCSALGAGNAFVLAVVLFLKRRRA